MDYLTNATRFPDISFQIIHAWSIVHCYKRLIFLHGADSIPYRNELLGECWKGLAGNFFGFMIFSFEDI